MITKLKNFARKSKKKISINKKNSDKNIPSYSKPINNYPSSLIYTCRDSLNKCEPAFYIVKKNQTQNSCRQTGKCELVSITTPEIVDQIKRELDNALAQDPNVIENDCCASCSTQQQTFKYQFCGTPKPPNCCSQKKCNCKSGYPSKCNQNSSCCKQSDTNNDLCECCANNKSTCTTDEVNENSCNCSNTCCPKQPVSKCCICQCNTNKPSTWSQHSLRNEQTEFSNRQCCGRSKKSCGCIDSCPCCPIDQTKYDADIFGDESAQTQFPNNCCCGCCCCCPEKQNANTPKCPLNQNLCQCCRTRCIIDDILDPPPECGQSGCGSNSGFQCCCQSNSQRNSPSSKCCSREKEANPVYSNCCCCGSCCCTENCPSNSCGCDNNNNEQNNCSSRQDSPYASNKQYGSTMSENDCSEKDSSVRVAVRIRPQNPRELIDMCRICTTVTPEEPQIILGLDKAFTFDCVFDVNSTQDEIYAECVERLVIGALNGYNGTVLAYGQTGSGKTYTMGTGFDRDLNEMQQGIVVRAVRHIFSGIEDIQSNEGSDTSSFGTVQFSVAAQFMELYNEELIDLLDPYSKGRVFKIHEDASGQITVSGATIKPIHGPQDALMCLQQGALARTTASTQMNDQSSRSHALFTILIRRQRVISGLENGIPDGDVETLTSKFHFVDLAGSERLKRTGATGERAREGISINCGLLALGNCISALGDKSRKTTHIPYRDSKLTRLLQDSLGGNSQTLMIACVSPSDRDFMETLNTLKYANRARNIKNKVHINQDQSSRTITQLRREIAALQMELLDYKQGKRTIDAEGNSSLSDTFYENSMLIAENRRLQQRLKAMQETINMLTESNAYLKLEKEANSWAALTDSDQSVTNIIGGYLNEIEKLQAKLIESEEMFQQLKNSSKLHSTPRTVNTTKSNIANTDELLNIAKREVEKDRELLMSRSLCGFNEDNNLNSTNIPIVSDSGESDESDTESDDKTKEMQADLMDINSDIEIKTKLIEQLELSQQRIQLMRQHYEEKLNVLNCKIVNTQKERDEVLANISVSHGNHPPNDKMKKVRDEYERKINDMQREMRKLQHAQREHDRQQREMKAQEVKLRNLRAELTELKCNKTRLIKKMNEETNRHREEETRKTREIAQLRKEQRRNENAVKSLQAQVHAKEQILKRKTEEVSALRRSQRGLLSRKAAGRVAVKLELNKFNTRIARQNWDKLYRAISHAARNKQAVVQLEKELERLMTERETLSRDLSIVQNRQNRNNVELANEEDAIKSNLNYVQDNIEHVQQAIMEFEEGKDSVNNDAQNIQMLIGNVNTIDEAKFLLERLTNSAVMFSCDSALIQNRLLEHETLLKEVQQESGIQQQLLQHFLAQNHAVQISDLFESLNLGATKANANNLSGSQRSLNSNGTYDIPNEDKATNMEQNIRSRSPSPIATIDILDKNSKIRRRTAHAQDLLFGDGQIDHNEDVLSRSFTQHETQNRSFIPLSRVPSAPGSLKQSIISSPSISTKNNDSMFNVPAISAVVPSNPLQSPRLNRRNMISKGSPALEDDVSETPNSPPVYRRVMSREESSTYMNAINVGGSGTDVFSRLGAGTQNPAPGGSIQKTIGKIKAGVPLFCTHTVSGHNNSVLSIQVDNNDILYTAAADRTVKVWDLNYEAPLHCLSTHPGPVIAVQHDSRTGLLFSASGPYVRVWDLRTSNSKPIRTLSSSGQILSGAANITGVVPGESPITALSLGASGNLYTAASDKVRIWNLNSLNCIGKLTGGHQAAVMCVTAWEGDCSGSIDFVATGSKDHYVKVFEVPRIGGIVYPLLNLEPPHYDGVQALAVAQDAIGADAELFSGSRDSGIKRWDLKSGELKQSLNNAHKGWVSGMAICGDVLLSGCRGGIIRLWNIKTCESLAEMKTDSTINDIVVAGQRIFTASSSGDVRIWRFTSQEHFPTPTEKK